MLPTRSLSYLIFAAAACCVTLAHAKPVEIDTDSAHIIVVRPIDLWSGDTSALEDTMKSVTERRVSYDVFVDGTRYRGSPLVFQGISDHPVTLGVEAELKSLNTRLVRQDAYNFHVTDSTPLAPSDYPRLAKLQDTYYQRFVLRQGDPRTLPGHMRARNLLGNALSVGALFLPSGALGASTGVQVMANSGLAEGIGNLPRQAMAAMAPSPLPPLDPAAYKAIDVRRIEFNRDTTGQILIAYKVDKTPDIERDALIRAIVTATGADTTAEAVAQSREADYQQRLLLWDACVADGKCKKEGDQ
ncbi:hypothetical protein [Ralstonia pseudosolanacearum]|jgi:hypothetical protein|uniref:hypothetical protein n=1 Tax=Ralstonia pseudosolanacearum TaxID=1310165 RepID=UPI0011CDFD56|nr:hypothetical protein [Ralstonia pseudosolanacearum]